MLLEKLRRRRNAEPTAADLEEQAIQARLTAWRQLDPQGPEQWPPAAPRVIDEAIDIPDIPADQLTAEILTDAVVNHGAIIVRGYLDAATAGDLRADVARVLALMDDSQAGRRVDGDAGGTAAWWRELTDPATGGVLAERWRDVNRGNFSGECPVVDSPHVAKKLLALYDDRGTIDLVEEYLGERPAASLEKWVLRCVPPKLTTSWHQDGAFLGEGTRTINMWIALSDCGEDASGLDIVPVALDGIVETGTGGAYFSWDVGPEVVDKVLDGKEVLSPVFVPGDAVFFDGNLLHSTGIKPGMTKDRYALETWFFAPSHFPPNYNGILL